MTHAGPLFSVIVPTCNRAGNLAACLQSLERIALPPGGFEVIVVDDSGEPAAPPSADVSALTLNIRAIRLPENLGPASARNAGASVALGRFLAFLDDDCLAGEDWLRQLHIALESTPGCAAGGQIINGVAWNPFAAANQAILDEVYRYYNSDPSQCRFFASMNLAVPTAAFRELGGFDPSFRTSEDRDFCARWLARGRPLVFAENAIVSHEAAPSWREFTVRHFRFGSGACHFRELHARSTAGGPNLEPADFYRRLVTSPFRSSFSPAAILSALLCCLSQIASALGYWAAHRERARHRPM